MVEAQSLSPGTEFQIQSSANEDKLAYLGTGIAAQSDASSDIVKIPQNETGIASAHVAIQYRKTSRKFFAKDNGTESGTYLKVEKPLLLSQGDVLAFGESSMAVMMVGKKLTLKFLGGLIEDQTLYLRHCLCPNK